jgi:hypothetical protein
MDFEEVIAVMFVGPEHPQFKAPNIGNKRVCVLNMRAMISWEQVSGVIESIEYPGLSTIATCFGPLLIRLSYPEAQNKFLEAREKVDKELQFLRQEERDYTVFSQNWHIANSTVLKNIEKLVNYLVSDKHQ